MQTKPDHQEIKNLIDHAHEIDKRLRESIDAQRGEITAVRRAADAFYTEKFRTALEELDIEILSQGKQGIRISYLRNAGIDNIFQLSKMSCAEIEALDGIGAQGARKIWDTTQKIVDNTKDKL